MYPCAKCDRKFLYREDCETHDAICDIAQRRIFKPFRFAQSTPRFTQSTVVANSTVDDIAALRREVAELRSQVEKLSRSAARTNRAAVIKTPNCIFSDWIASISATQTHLRTVFVGELIDGLEAVFRDAIADDALPISAHVMRTRTELRCFATPEQGGDAQWRKMTDDDYTALITGINRKLNAQFEIWRSESNSMQVADEGKFNCAITCMAKIYGVSGRSTAVRAVEFRRRAQKIMAEREAESAT